MKWVPIIAGWYYLSCRVDSQVCHACEVVVNDVGVAAFYWIDSPLSYALIGRMERDELLKLARIVYDNL